MPAIIQVTGPPIIRETSPGSGSWEVSVPWQVYNIPTGDSADGRSAEPLNVETVGVTNNRIETEARARMLAVNGVTITGAIHVYGGRTS